MRNKEALVTNEVQSQQEKPKSKFSLSKKQVIGLTVCIALTVLAIGFTVFMALSNRSDDDHDSSSPLTDTTYQQLLDDVAALEDPEEMLERIADVIDQPDVDPMTYLWALSLQITTLANDGRFEEAKVYVYETIDINTRAGEDGYFRLEENYEMLAWLYNKLGDQRARYEAMLKAREYAMAIGNNINLSFYNRVIMEFERNN